MVTLRSRWRLQGTAERSAWNRANMDTTKARVGKIWRKKLHRFGGLVVGRPGTSSWFFACRSCWLREALDKTIPFLYFYFTFFYIFCLLCPPLLNELNGREAFGLGYITGGSSTLKAGSSHAKSCAPAPPCPSTSINVIPGPHDPGAGPCLAGHWDPGQTLWSN